MNKCHKCHAEFEGNFCPECGTKFETEKVCPNCNAKVAINVKFCNNCGYKFEQEQQQKPKIEQSKQPVAEKPIKNNTEPKTESKTENNSGTATAVVAEPKQPFPVWQVAAKILPVFSKFAFVLFALLLWAFFAAPFGTFFGESIGDVYSTMGGIIDDFLPIAQTSIAFGVIAFVYASVMVAFYFIPSLDCKKIGKFSLSFILDTASNLFYIVYFALGCAASAKAKEIFIDGGSYAGVMIAFSIIFMLFSVGALVADIMLRKRIAEYANACAEKEKNKTDKAEQRRQAVAEKKEKAYQLPAEKNTTEPQKVEKPIGELATKLKRLCGGNFRLFSICFAFCAFAMCVLTAVAYWEDGTYFMEHYGYLPNYMYFIIPVSLVLVILSIVFGVVCHKKMRLYVKHKNVQSVNLVDETTIRKRVKANKISMIICGVVGAIMLIGTIISSIAYVQSAGKTSSYWDGECAYQKLSAIAHYIDLKYETNYGEYLLTSDTFSQDYDNKPTEKYFYGISRNANNPFGGTGSLYCDSSAYPEYYFYSYNLKAYNAFSEFETYCNNAEVDSKDIEYISGVYKAYVSANENYDTGLGENYYNMFSLALENFDRFYGTDIRKNLRTAERKGSSYGYYLDSKTTDPFNGYPYGIENAKLIPSSMRITCAEKVSRFYFDVINSDSDFVVFYKEVLSTLYGKYQEAMRTQDVDSGIAYYNALSFLAEEFSLMYQFDERIYFVTEIKQYGDDVFLYDMNYDPFNNVSLGEETYYTKVQNFYSAVKDAPNIHAQYIDSLQKYYDMYQNAYEQYCRFDGFLSDGDMYYNLFTLLIPFATECGAMIMFIVILSFNCARGKFLIKAFGLNGKNAPQYNVITEDGEIPITVELLCKQKMDYDAYRKYLRYCKFNYFRTSLGKEPIDEPKYNLLVKTVKVIASVVAVAVVALAIIIAVAVDSANIFKVSKINEIKSGDGKEKVSQVLGKADIETDYQWAYFSSNYSGMLKEVEKLVEQMANVSDFNELAKLMEKQQQLEQQLKNMEYKYIYVTFNSEGQVVQIRYNFDAKGADTSNEKEVMFRTDGFLKILDKNIYA